MRPAHELGQPHGAANEPGIWSLEKSYDYTVDPPQVYYVVGMRITRPFDAKQWAELGKRAETLAKSLEQD